MKKQIFCLILPFLLCSCSHLKYASIQAEYARIHNAEPGQLHLKHMIDRETFAVYGKTIDESSQFIGLNLAIAAYSDKFKKNERVDTMHFAGAGTHYGLNLPAGDYTLLVFVDKDANEIFDPSEIVGQKTIVLNNETAPEMVMGHVDIKLNTTPQIHRVEPIPVPNVPEPKQSLYYPGGAIRSLDDPLFDDNIAILGMYDPASFTEKAPTRFFALEEDLGYKIPVVFVHGIGGTPRAFAPIVEHMDRTRYKPWFHYYPSGGDLEQLAHLFYKVYLSGKVSHTSKMPMIIIAHSMGGLIVREALNQYGSRSDENLVKLFVTIATPFGGHPAAASGEKYGLIVLPAWRDVNPNNRFIKNLYRRPLPESVNHHLIYAYQNPNDLKLNQNSDGVVPLFSQLHPMAQIQSRQQFGFNSSHTAILENEVMIAHLLEQMDKVRNFFPEDHLEVLMKGGYDVELDDRYSPRVQYIIHHYGKYWMAVSKGTLKPFFPDQELFLKMISGEVPAIHEEVKGWMKFMQEYPDIDR